MQGHDRTEVRRVRARELRVEGALLREIAGELHASLSTVSEWCAGLAAPARSRHGGDADHMQQMREARWGPVLAQRQLEREAVRAASARRVGELTDRELDLVAAAAYWAEGSKSKPWARRERVTFINSDAGLVVVWLEFLRRHGVAADRIRLSLSIHDSADVEVATHAWSRVTGFPLEAFGRPMLKRHNPLTVRKNVDESYAGCLVVRVLGSRLLYQEIEGLWQGVVAAV